MNKRLFSLFIIMFLVTFVFTGLVLTDVETNKLTMSAPVVVSRKTLQNYIVSTAVSYYYNNKYTDYDGYWADESHSEYSTMYNYSPEMISRSRYIATQCDAFVTDCYIHTFGFDFSKYKDSLLKGKYTSYYTNNGVKKYAKDDVDVFKNAYKYFNKVYSVSFMQKIAKDNPKDPMVVLTYQKGKISTLKNVKDTSKTVTDLLNGDGGQEILDYIISQLQPGDIILNDGHALLWVGDIFESSGGAIHSTAVTSKMTRDSNGNITEFGNGYDAYDVRYSSKDYVITKSIIYHGSSINDDITILRPINAMCTFNGNNCTLNSNYAKIVSNASARNKLNRLRVEQFIYDETGSRILGDASSVNVGDEISYNFYLTNKSNFSFCSSGTKTNKDDCTSSGYCSNATFKKKDDCENNGFKWNYNKWISIKKNTNYSGITITSTIPNNTKFVSCSNNCKYSNGKVIWSNISMPYSNTSEVKLGFTVKVLNDNSDLEFDGMTLTYDSSNLKMGSFKTLVNSSINGKYATEFNNIINNDVKNTRCSTSYDYVINTYNSFIKSKHVYTTVSGDLSKIITVDNIVNGIFKEVNFDNVVSYTKKTSSEVNNLSGNYKIINQMLVPGFYGGYRYNKLYYSKNMDYFNKIKPMWSTRVNMNVGDIIVTLKKSGNSFKLKNIMMYDGMDGSTPTFIYCENKKVIRHKKREFAKSDSRSKFYTTWYANGLLIYELYSADLYVVLRPSMYYELQYREDEPIIPPTEPVEPVNPPTDPVTPTPTPKPEPEPTKPTDPVTPTPTPKPEPEPTNQTNETNESNIDNVYEVKLYLDKDAIGEKKIYFSDSYNNWSNEKGKFIASIDIPKKEGHVFKGFFTGYNCSGNMIINSKGRIVSNNINSNTTLYNCWYQNNKNDSEINEEKNSLMNSILLIIGYSSIFAILLFVGLFINMKKK